MRYDADNSMTGISYAKFRVFTFFVPCFLLPAVLLFCDGCDRDVSPPDVSSCTRIEVRYPHPTVDYFLPSTGLQSVLSPDEKEYIKSIECFTVNDPERIKAFAQDVSSGLYDGRMWGRLIHRPVDVVCYRGNKRITSFKVFGDLIITEHKSIFRYPRGSPNLEIIEPPKIRPFKLRFQCGLNMQALYTAGPLHQREVISYPEPTEWCDAVMRDRRNTSYVSEERMRGHFKCPSAGEGKCHYAMNPHCEPDSPWDTVLLFETKAGWNQHGGPEIFAFNNHNPRGGCVLLNDGTVKFIRTELELLQLRWE